MRLSLLIFFTIFSACGGESKNSSLDIPVNTDTGIKQDSGTSVDKGPVVAPDLGPAPRWTDTQPTKEDSNQGGADNNPQPPQDTDTPPQEVRFIAIGDTGEGNQGQIEVAEAIANKCASDGCDFVVLLGDNIYDNGVDSLEDDQWEEKFEGPYADIDIPFYATLGNHDDGCLDVMNIPFFDICSETEGAGTQFWKGDVQIQYSDVSTKWKMPGRIYDFSQGPAHFFSFDTNTMMWKNATSAFPDAGARYAEQYPIMDEAIANSQSAWKIGFGHHPYISNGAHGNAGDYEGVVLGLADSLLGSIPGISELTETARGGGVKEGVENLVCNRIDIYLSGHDHNRQWLVSPENCPDTEFVVSGAGAKTKGFDGDNPVHWQDASTEGFIYFKIAGNELLAQVIDKNGTMNFERRLYKCDGVLWPQPCP